MIQLLPIEQWRRGEVLVDPTGVPYDPNSPPAIINTDPILGSAVSFARQHAKRIGVTILCGMQTEAADLGQPGEFERHMRRAHIFGSSKFGLPPGPELAGYHGRVMSAYEETARSRPGLFQSFNTMDWRNMEESGTLQTLQNIEAAIGVAIDALAVMRSLDLDMVSVDMVMDTEAKAMDVFAGETHLTNHLNWLVLANACDQVRMFTERTNTPERIHVLIDEDPVGLDLVRKFGALGIEDVALQQNRKGAWPPDVVGQVMDFGSVMTTGRLDAAY